MIMSAEKQIESSLFRLLQHMEQEEFKGFDPYDGLTSPLFKLPFLSSQSKLRFYAQQLVKRSPVNLRPILRIKKRLNPVTAGLAIQSYSSLFLATGKEEYRQKALVLTLQLKNLSATGYHGNCWGYDFPWEARYATIPAYQPTVVATGIITNGLYESSKAFQHQEAAEMVADAAGFVMNDLNRQTEKDGSFCFSYSPFDKEMVFNASMKGARLLSQAYAITGNAEYISTAAQAVKWVMKYQQEDGAWIYSKRETGKWVDNYHTGYILDCLHTYIQLSGDNTFLPGLDKGLNYYTTNFITAEGQPKFYHQEIYPVDCTSAGQTLLTLVRFNKTQDAIKVANWMIEHMQDGDGHFYFRKYKSHTEKTNFMRWSNAWMLAGMSALYSQLH